jgi:hypothetical protein
LPRACFSLNVVWAGQGDAALPNEGPSIFVHIKRTRPKLCCTSV